MKSGILHLEWILLIGLCCITIGSSALSNEIIIKKYSVETEVLKGLHSKQLNNDGDSLIIGSAISGTLKDLYPDVNQPILKDYTQQSSLEGQETLVFKGSEKTKVFKRSSRSYHVTTKEKKKEVDLSEYFMYITREVWYYSHTQYKNPFLYFRVVNEMISIKDIHDVKYYDGIQVSITNYFPNERRVKVKEIKCFAGHRIQLKHVECEKSGFSQLPSYKVIPNLVERIRVILPRQLENKMYDSFDITDTVAAHTISSSGISLKIGTRDIKQVSGEELGASNLRESADDHYYTCEPAFGESPQLFTPDCYRIFSTDVGKIYAKISNKDFAKSFTIVNRNIHVCTSGTRGAEIIRVQNTIIGKNNINTIEFGHRITELYSIALPDGTNTIRFTELSYFNLTTRRYINNNIWYKFREEKRSLLAIQLDKGHGLYTHTIRDDYKLSPSTLYRTLISLNGFDLRVGTKPQIKIERGTNPPKCTKMKKHEYSDKFNTELKLKVVQDDAYHTLWAVDDKLKYSYISKEAWMCEIEATSKFITIANKVQVLSPVREIETFDGVLIKDITPHNSDSRSLEILELKFYNYQTGTSAYYDGELQFQSRDAALTIFSAKEYNAMNQDDIVPWINQMPVRKLNLLEKPDTHYEGKDNVNFLISNEGKHINFSVEQPSSLMKEFLFVCKPEKESTTLLPYFKILDDSTLIEELQNAEDKTFNSRYFENVVNEVVKCSTTEEMRSIFRVVNTQCLKKSTPHSIGKIYHTYMDKVWYETMDDNYVVKIEGVRYTHWLKPYSVFDYYEGNYFIIDEKPRRAAWKSGTYPMADEEEKSKLSLDIEVPDEAYKLNSGRMYKFTLPTNNMGNGQTDTRKTLKIGSKWERVHGTRLSIINCVEDTEKLKDDANFQTKVSTEGDNKDYNVENKVRIWSCTDKMNGEKIYRVLNQFAIKHEKLKQVKELFFYDGVTAVLHCYKFSTEERNDLKVREIKYINATNRKIVKFDGILEFENHISNTIRSAPKTFGLYFIKDIYYILNENEVFKTYVGGNGPILEVGQKYKSIFEGNQFSNVQYQKIECTKLDKNFAKDIKFMKSAHPKVVMQKQSSEAKSNQKDNGFIPVTMDKSTLLKYFESSQTVWKCKDHLSRPVLYRVVNKLKFKSEQSTKHVFHHDGVTVYMDDDKKTVIEEIKYLIKDKSNYFEEVKYEGLVDIKNVVQPDRFEDWEGENFRGTDYFMDTEILYSANLNEAFETIEVDLQWEKMIEDVNDVTCVKESDYPSERYTLKIFAGPSSKPYSPPLTLGAKAKYFEVSIKEIWHCEKDKKVLFHRIVNKYILSNKYRIFYPAGVSVEYVKYPNNENKLQLTEVKFVDPSTEQNVKYVGRLKLVANVIKGAENFLVSYNYRTCYANPGMSNSDTGSYWNLDTLRFFAWTKAELSGYIMEVVIEKSFQTKLINTNGMRMFQIGTVWEEYKTPYVDKFQCMLDEWNAVDIPRYIPKVVEYVDDQLYQLDAIGFQQVFEMKETKVWICQSLYRDILRVTSVFHAKEPIFAIKYIDGVEIETVTQDGKNKLQITETIYMDVMTSEVLKMEYTEYSHVEKTKKKSSPNLIQRSFSSLKACFTGQYVPPK